MPACSLDTCTLGDDFEVDPSEVICNEEMGSIGDGNFGKVWSGTFRGQAVAIKTMRSMSTHNTSLHYIYAIHCCVLYIVTCHPSWVKKTVTMNFSTLQGMLKILAESIL